MLAPAIEPEGMVGDGDNRDGAEHVAASASNAGVPNNNARKNRCKERDYFHITPAVNGEPARAKCIDCGTQVAFSYGTSVLRKHRNSANCKKKRATIEEATNCPRYCLTLKFCIASLFQYRIMLVSMCRSFYMNVVINLRDAEPSKVLLTLQVLHRNA